MEVDFKYLRNICPKHELGICGELKYFDCSENNCPMNAAQNTKEAAQNGPTKICPNAIEVPVVVKDHPDEKVAFVVCRTYGKHLSC